MLRKLLSSLFVIALLAPAAFAQVGSVTGTVTDAETGETVPGANVVLVEINRGTATNTDGEFTIRNIPAGTYTFRVSFVGFQTFEAQISITGNEELTQNVELQPGAVGLDELVVTGYGVESKRELTGSITKVSSQDFQDVPVQNTAGILQGRAAGVQVTSTSGNAGAGFQVRVRGTGSINADSDPLYIVDGVQLSFTEGSEELDESPLNGINPKDIESIEVLKDAAAAAIYGAQAANGVVLITTKRGQQGDTRVTASVQQGVRFPIENVDYMNRDQFLEFRTLAVINGFDVSREVAEQSVRDTWLPLYGFDPSTPFNELPDTDWLDFIYKDSHSQTYNLAVSGGDENTRFRVSGAFEKTGDQIKDSQFRRYNLRTNLDHQVNSKLSTQVNINLSNSELVGICQDGFFINCPVSGATFTSPLARPFDDEGEYSNFFPIIGASSNPAVVFGEYDRTANVTQILGNVSATYNFTSWLSLTSQFGLDWRSTHDRDFRTPIAQPSQNGTLNESIANVINFNVNTVLNFRQTFQDVHNFSGLVGGEYRRDFTRELEATGFGFPNQFFDVLSATADPIATTGFDNEFRIAGYFGNLKYNYDSRYFLNLTARYDGSSRFGSENRWGFFPSASVAWRISEEDFFNVDFVDDLKLRVSYGETGNSEIGNFAARGLFGTGGLYSGTTGISPTQLANPQLTWEEAKTINLGTDYSFFRGRISGAIDVYQRDNESLLLNNPLPGDSGFGSITRNIGQVRNQGIEFEINSINLDWGDFVWSTRFNIAIQQNEVLELSEGTEALNPSGTQPIEVGRPLNGWNVVRWAGVNPADGRPMWYDIDGNITYNPTTEDQVPFDGGEQDVIGGFGNTINYKGFTLDAFFQYSFGQTARPDQVFFFGMAQVSGSGTNGLERVLTKSWKEPGDLVGIPKPFPGFTYPGTTFYSMTSSNALWDASYIRLKNITLSYNLPRDLSSKIGLRNIRVYATGLNLVTWTSFVGFDPEIAGATTRASFPAARQVNGGIELQF